MKRTSRLKAPVQSFGSNNQPIVGVAKIIKWTGFTAPGAYKIIDRLKDLKILEALGDSQ